MKNALLKVENISKSYAVGETVWSKVQFELQRGEFLYVLGGSGAGKSSLLRTLASFELPSEGKIWCHGVDLLNSSQREVERVRKRIAYVPQNLGLIPELSIRDHIEMSQSWVPAGDKTEAATLDAYVQLMNLKDKWNRPVGTLSGGERQRVSILRALSRKHDLIIADEPTGAQDFEMTWKLMDLFVKINLAGTALLLATHDLEMVRRLRKRCAILKDGVFKVEDRV